MLSRLPQVSPQPPRCLATELPGTVSTPVPPHRSKSNLCDLYTLNFKSTSESLWPGVVQMELLTRSNVSFLRKGPSGDDMKSFGSGYHHRYALHGSMKGETPSMPARTFHTTRHSPLSTSISRENDGTRRFRVLALTTPVLP